MIFVRYKRMVQPKHPLYGQIEPKDGKSIGISRCGGMKSQRARTTRGGQVLWTFIKKLQKSRNENEVSDFGMRSMALPNMQIA